MLINFSTDELRFLHASLCFLEECSTEDDEVSIRTSCMYLKNKIEKEIE